MKYSKGTFVILLVLLSLTSFSQEPFQRYYSPFGQNRYSGNSVLQDVDSGFFLVGNLGVENYPDEKLILMKTDKNGNTVWVKTYDSMHSVHMIKTFDNKAIVCGSSDKNWWPPNACLMKVSFMGDSLWKKRYFLNSYSSLYCVTQTSDSGYIAVGCITTGYNLADILVIKTNSIGDTLWTKTFGLPNKYNDGRCILETTNHEVAFCGTSGKIINGDYDSLSVVFFKTDSVGNLLVQKVYSYYKKIDAYCMTHTTSGGYLISGNNSGYAYFIKTDSNGDTLWTKHTSFGDYSSNARSVIPANDSGYFWCGDGQISYYWWTSVVMMGKLSESGLSDWIQSYNIGAGQYGRELNTTQDNGFIIIGDSSRNSIYMIKTDEEGVITGFKNRDLQKTKTTVFPNPAQEILEGISDKDIESLIIITPTGIPVYRMNKVIRKFESFKIPVRDIELGLYFLKMIFTDSSIKIIPIIRN